MGNSNAAAATTRVDDARAATLAALGAGHPVTSLHWDRPTGLVVVGSADGASRLLFPSAKAPDVQEIVAASHVKEGADVEGQPRPEYRALTLRPRANEAVRAAYIDAREALLFVAIGDACVQVFNLRNLRPQDPDRPERGLHHEMYAYGRMHTFGACVNAYILRHERHFLLVLRRSVCIYELSFPRALPQDQQPGEANETGQHPASSHKDRLAEVVAPNGAESSEEADHLQVRQGDVELTVSQNCLPCSFDGRYLVLLKSEKYGVFDIEVRDWATEKKDVVRTITVHRRLADVIIPESVQVRGDVLVAVLNLRTIVGWSVSTGKELFRGHSQHGDLVATVLCDPKEMCMASDQDPEEPSPALVSLSRCGKVTLWSGTVATQTFALPPRVSQFALAGPYFLEPALGRGALESGSKGYVLRSLLFNDDTGVHMVAF